MTCATWPAGSPCARPAIEVPFKPARVVLQDFTGVPAVVDLAAMRSAMKRLGGDPKRINPLVPVDLVIDHSVQVDRFGSPEALGRERGLGVPAKPRAVRVPALGPEGVPQLPRRAAGRGNHPPGEPGVPGEVRLSSAQDAAGPVALPDTLVGTDSHTTMINGLGVVGWGVGGIEAEAVMLGQPLYMLAPEVIGFELSGGLPAGATATDLVLTVTQILRKEGVVDKFVEFFGPALADMKVADRALVANMAPEYGATMGFFPIDEQTLAYLRETGRTADEVELVERYAKEQQLFRSLASAADGSDAPHYTKVLRLDLATVEPSLAGPKRPQDRVPLGEVKQSFRQSLRLPAKERGFALTDEQVSQTAQVEGDGTIGHGAVVIASITSCTNTSNPERDAGRRIAGPQGGRAGLKVKPHVKTSLCPGQPRGDRLSQARPAWTNRWNSWASTPSATAA